MKLSKEFIIGIILVVVIGIGVLVYTQWQAQQAAVTTIPEVTPQQTQTVDKQLSDVESDLEEVDTIESDLDIAEIESLETDLDPSQFDIL